MTHDIKSSKLAEQFHVCLLRPKGSMNVGAAARAMSNLGFSNLSLISPRGFSQDQALETACWAGELVKSAKICLSMEEALGSMQDVVGFTSAYGRNRPQHLALSEWVAQLNLASLPRTALLFGPEESGLENDDLASCRVLVRIPSAIENPSYNLAQAVLLVLYEVSSVIAGASDDASASDRAEWREFGQLDLILDQLGESTKFLGENTSVVAQLLKSIFRRTQLSEREMQILLGYFARITKSIQG